MEGCRRRLKDGKTYRSPLHNEVARVPLLISIPGAGASRIPGVVSLPDVMPTILDLAGVEIPQRVQAQSLLPMIKNQGSCIHQIVVTSYPFEQIGDVSRRVDDREREVVEISPSTITDGKWDLLFGISGEPVELYRAREDEGHHNNLIDLHPDVAEELHQKFVRFLEATNTPSHHLVSRRKLWADQKGGM